MKERKKDKKAHHKSPRRLCATPGCGKEAKRGRLCTRCSTIYVNRRYHAKKWAAATDEELMKEVARTRRAEKKQMRVAKEASMYVRNK